MQATDSLIETYASAASCYSKFWGYSEYPGAPYGTPLLLIYSQNHTLSTLYSTYTKCIVDCKITIYKFLRKEKL